jgi:hypothetical protein
MHPRLSALLIAAGAVAALAACGDPTAIKARLPNFEERKIIYALNGSPASVPVAVRVRGIGDVIPGPDFNFDIAFDLTDTGTVRLLTARTIATQVAGSINRVGLRDSPALNFDAVIDPPSDLFIYDSTLVVPVGRTVLIDVFDQSCQTEAILGFNIKAKLKVDSIDVPNRAIYIHMVSNPNCGFRQLVPGGQTPEK